MLRVKPVWYQHGEHSQLSFTSLSDPQAISGLNTYDVCAMRIIRVISQLKTCQLTGFHRLFTGTQLNPFFQAVLFERSNRRWTSNQTCPGSKSFEKHWVFSGRGEEAFRNKSAMDLDGQKKKCNEFRWL